MSLSRASFDYVRAALRERSAHFLEDDKAYLVETRLLSLARRHGFSSVEALVQHLQARRNELLLSELVEAMTINETSFFRDGPAFDYLAATLLPDLIEKRAADRCLTIWSAACSSGQEPYSLALMVRHHFPALAGWNVRLLASDLSTAMLDRARHGSYTELEVSRGLEPHFRSAYFHKHGPRWQIQDELRRMVEFRCINLSGPWPELPQVDLVLLRNVLIYFEVSTRQQVLDRVRAILRPDGYLMLGGAETVPALGDGFTPVPATPASLFRPCP